MSFAVGPKGEADSKWRLDDATFTERMKDYRTYCFGPENHTSVYLTAQLILGADPKNRTSVQPRVKLTNEGEKFKISVTSSESSWIYTCVYARKFRSLHEDFDANVQHAITRFEGAFNGREIKKHHRDIGLD